MAMGIIVLLFAALDVCLSSVLSNSYCHHTIASSSSGTSLPFDLPPTMAMPRLQQSLCNILFSIRI